MLCVLMIHTAMNFTEFDVETSSFLCGNIFDSIARAGVPLFVMVSGALMLDEKKQVTIKQVFSKYILNILILFILWSSFYASIIVFKNILTGDDILIPTVLIKVIFGEFHMWYLFMIIGLYTTIPVLRLFVKEENSKVILYMLTISLLFYFCPVLLKCFSNLHTGFEMLNTLFQKIDIGLLGGQYVVYFISGWYIYNIGIKHKKYYT